MTRASVDVSIALNSDSILATWSSRGEVLELRLDRVPNAHPRWIGSAADLDATGDRRGTPAVIDALARFGLERGESVALFHDDGRLEWLVEP